MALLHLIKLCVGAGDVDDLRDWQSARLAEMKQQKEVPELFHTTRMVPARMNELLDGGSLYWVMKGIVRCRQKLLDIRPFVDVDGIRRCHLVLDPEIILTRRRERRPFQGWRYLDPKDAPSDAIPGAADDDEMPPELRAELEALGLL